MKLPWWTWPAWQLGRVRPDLRAAAAADIARLSDLPSVVRSAIVPAIAILVPAVVMVLHASTTPYQQPIPDSFSLVIGEVYTESLPVMAAMLAIGLLAPAAGALAVVVFALGDLVLTTTRGQLDPPQWALLARLISYLLLWVLAVEIPLMGRAAAEWRIAGETATAAKRFVGIAVGAAIVVATTYIWVQAAPLLIGVVFRLTTGWGSPTVAAMQALQLDGNYLLAAAAILGILLLGLRYLGRQPYLTIPLAEGKRGIPGGPIVRHVVAAGLAFIVLLGVVTKPIDVAILLPTLLLARPLASFLLRVTGAGTLLARLPLPLRLIIGFAVAVAVAWVVVSVLGFQSDLSGFFTMVVALAVGYVVMTFFLEADAGSPSRPVTIDSPAAGGGVLTTLMVVTGLLMYLGLPALAFADNGGDHVDGWASAAAAALAAGAAGALAAFAKATMAGDGVPQFNWTRDEKGDLVGRFDDQPIQPIDMSGLKGPCVLTTACVTALGKSDDCHELMSFRRLRDEYLSRNPEGIAVIEDYYRTAPQVVAAVQATAAAASIWPQIYAEWVEPVVGLVDANRIDEATSLAVSRYETIKRQYRVE